ncbi:MAG: hypothetical protein JKY61_12835 [Planctomycetes bacterium]|nr:hypothetical protein [Planctomycetota bacterium]
MDNNSIKSVLLYRAPNQLEATLIEAMLNESGVQAWTVGGQASIGFGELGADALLIDIRIPEALHAEGIRLIDQFFADRKAGMSKPEANDSENWNCTQCGEDVEPAFSTCWSCEAPRENTDNA